jgi:hypothetical protein
VALHGLFFNPFTFPPSALITSAALIIHPGWTILYSPFSSCPSPSEGQPQSMGTWLSVLSGSYQMWPCHHFFPPLRKWTPGPVLLSHWSLM